MGQLDIGLEVQQFENQDGKMSVEDDEAISQRPALEPIMENDNESEQEYRPGQPREF